MNKLTPKEKLEDQLISVRWTSSKLVRIILGCEWRKPIRPGCAYCTEPQRHIGGFGKSSEIFGE